MTRTKSCPYLRPGVAWVTTVRYYMRCQSCKSIVIMKWKINLNTNVNNGISIVRHMVIYLCPPTQNSWIEEVKFVHMGCISSAHGHHKSVKSRAYWKCPVSAHDKSHRHKWPLTDNAPIGHILCAPLCMSWYTRIAGLPSVIYTICAIKFSYILYMYPMMREWEASHPRNTIWSY